MCLKTFWKYLMSANMLHCMFENQDPELQVFLKYFYYKVVPMVQALKNIVYKMKTLCK